MFHIKNSISAGLTLIVLLTLTPAFAQNDDTSPLTGRAAVIDDSPESVKLRVGSGDPVAGKEKSQLCQGCHGEVGISAEPLIPKLAGQYAKYIVKQVHNYQNGKRSHRIMNAMAGTIDRDDDLADIAAYFASQDKMKNEDDEENSFGKNLFLHGDVSRLRLACVNCHGVRGKGLDPKIATFPVIGGQHKDYIRKQLMDFRQDIRTNSPNGIMNKIAKSLTDDELEAVAEYASEQ